jgi:hypothetical protein
LSSSYAIILPTPTTKTKTPMQYKVYLSEKVTPFYRENQMQFASALKVYL